MNAGRLVVAAGAVALLAAALYSQGCGDDGSPHVELRGNVASVVPQASAALESESPARFAGLDFGRLAALVLASADAQSAVCSAATQQRLTGVVACASTSSGAGSRTQCEHTRAERCTFSTRIALEEDGKPVIVSFIEDLNGNRAADSGESAAILLSPLPGRLCNGDVIEIPDVDVDFLTRTATAGGAITKQIDACPSETTPTGTPRTASPTPTAAPATATPTRTVTSAIPTATRTATAVTATATPTQTNTPSNPTVTPTSTPAASATPTAPSVTPTATTPSCFGALQPCSFNQQCCSGVCIGLTICSP